MQQRAQLCFNGNFLVDRSEYSPLASRVLTSSGVGALPIRRDAYAQDGAQGHLSSEGLGGDPKHRGAIRPKPQCKLSRMSQLLTIYRKPPATSNLLRDHARTLGLRREISRKSDLRRQ
jgi:hypothetical protein